MKWFLAGYLTKDIDELKNRLSWLKKNERIECVHGVRYLSCDPSSKDRTVDTACYIYKVSDKKYKICSDIFFDGHKLLKRAAKIAGVNKWYHFLDLSESYDYDDMLKIIDAIPKCLSEFVTEKSIYTFLSLNKKECEEECEIQRRPFLIRELENEIDMIEIGMEELEQKKAKLEKLKNM